MSSPPNKARVCVSATVNASAQATYEALTDPVAVLKWLPPGNMTGKFHSYDLRPGGGYVMSLYYPPEETQFRGKTADREDRVTVRFEVLDPPRRIVQTCDFASDDPGFHGQMKITISLDALDKGCRVTMLHENLPPALKPEDDEVGSKLSLQQLSDYLNSEGDGRL